MSNEGSAARSGGGFGTVLAVLAWLALIAAVLAAAALAVAGPGYQAKWWDLGFAFGKLMTYGGYVALGAAVLSLLLTLIFLVRGPVRLLLISVLALLLSGGPLSVLIPKLVKVREVPVVSALLGVKETVPPIHDITTDTQDPPQFEAAVVIRASDWMTRNPPEYDPAQGEQQLAFAGYADIRPAWFDEPVEAVYGRALKLAREDKGWLVIRDDPDARIIEAADTSFWFGFTDDVVIRIREEDGRTRLDMRSKSRIGRSDVGVNAERIRRFIRDMQKG